MPTPDLRPDARMTALAVRLHEQGPLARADLRVEQAEVPDPGRGEVRLAVEACGVCRTDLHIVEGDVPARRLPVTLGHQVVGRIEAGGEGVQLEPGSRVGVGWLAWACGECPACRNGRENLCPRAKFTGWDLDGGYAGAMLARADFVHPLLPALTDPTAAAPLMCGGVIGYRALRLAGVLDAPPARLLLVGFGNSASIALQAARALGWTCAVATRGSTHRQVAADLGAEWTGSIDEVVASSAEAAIIFAPAGELVAASLRAVVPGGTVVCAGITMTDIPGFPYATLYGERTLRSVANATRADARELLDLAARTGIRAEVEIMPTADARRALELVASSGVRASAVLVPR